MTWIATTLLFIGTHLVNRIVMSAKPEENRKSTKMLETTSFSDVGLPTSIVRTSVRGASGLPVDASFPSGWSFVGFAVISLCSANLLILERKKNEFCM